MTHINTDPSTSNSRTTRRTAAIGLVSVAALLVPAAASAIHASSSTPVETTVPPTATVAGQRIEHPVTPDTAERWLAAEQHQRVAACRATYRTADMLERCIEADGD